MIAFDRFTVAFGGGSLAFDSVTLALGAAFAAAGFAALALASELALRWQRYRAEFSRGVQQGLGRVFLFVDPRQLLMLNLALGLGLAGVAGLATGSWLAMTAAATVAGIAPGAVIRRLQRRRRQRFREQLGDATLLVASGLRSGLGVTQAMGAAASEMPAPLSEELGLVLREARLGTPLNDALAAMERRMPIPEVALFNAAIAVSAQTGGGLADALETLAASLRQRLAIEGKIDALTSQGRLQAVIVGLLPFFVTFALVQLDPDSMRPLWETRAGWIVIGVVLGLQTVGMLLVRRIVAIDV